MELVVSPNLHSLVLLGIIVLMAPSIRHSIHAPQELTPTVRIWHLPPSALFAQLANSVSKVQANLLVLAAQDTTAQLGVAPQPHISVLPVLMEAAPGSQPRVSVLIAQQEATALRVPQLLSHALQAPTAHLSRLKLQVQVTFRSVNLVRLAITAPWAAAACLHAQKATIQAHRRRSAAAAMQGTTAPT
jgi:hypothetical protein